MLQKAEGATGAQDPPCLAETSTDIAHGTQHERSNDRVEAGVAERQGGHITLNQGHPPSDPVCAPGGDRERGSADVDALNSGASRVDLQVHPGPDPDLKDVATRTPGHPSSSTPQADSVRDAHPRVEQSGRAQVPDLQTGLGHPTRQEPVAGQVGELHQDRHPKQFALVPVAHGRGRPRGPWARGRDALPETVGRRLFR